MIDIYIMPSGQIYTTDNKLNYSMTDKKVKMNQFSSDTFCDLIPLQNLDYSIVNENEKYPETNFDEPEPEYTTDNIQELKKSGKYIEDLMNKVKSQEQIEKDCANFEKDINDKKNSLSFLNVKSVEEGADWYKQQFPKLPDEFAEIMGRWNWGDLNDLTKKTVKNDKKKIAKGNKKTKEKYALGVNKGNFVISFD